MAALRHCRMAMLHATVLYLCKYFNPLNFAFQASSLILSKNCNCQYALILLLIILKHFLICDHFKLEHEKIEMRQTDRLMSLGKHL